MARKGKSPETHPVTTQIVKSIIDPVAEWCDAEHGRRQRFVEEVQKVVAPEKVTRQMVDAWVNTDPDKRSEPMLGNGIVIMRAAHNLGVEINIKNIIKNPEPKNEHRLP